MSAWRDKIGPATYRGVPFHVESAERAGGRRGVLHEYPLRDDPYVEDLGRQARLFPVEGYVVGDDYMAQRDELIAALEDTSGPGELVHPYHGTRSVICVRFRVRESTAEGGMARFAIDFGETPAQPAAPTAAPAAAEETAAAADDAETAAASDFLQAYAAIKTGIAELSSVVTSATAAVIDAMAPVIMTEQALASLKHDTDELVLDADTLVRTPALILGSLQATIATLASLPLRPTLGLAAILGPVYGFIPGSARPPGTTPSRLREQANWDALVRLVKTLAATQAARVAAAASFDSYDAATAARDAICDRLDEQMDGAGDAAFAALEQLRAALVRAVPGVDSDLPRIVAYTPPATVPSLVLAHRLYGDVSRESDLVTRNGIECPGFVVGGRALEVLSRG